MNLFTNCGTNNCLWILILILLAISCGGNSLEHILSGSCTPLLIALIYTMWKNGTLSNLFCGTGCNQGCGCK